ncbi:hypothetical protein GCM10010174_41990 [Kutzneria viridogrisea]|uniref:Uncharacterized protein n=1 Tax=Kutzneria albida DSM 43870 TaxID=1449976 RepID=W5VZY7_9PSEU|nr:hypothetical protein [Kutzneria albida]AHH94117.1 hypothetical protein KALB_742 [Kutzneria albida DSM 43870]
MVDDGRVTRPHDQQPRKRPTVEEVFGEVLPDTTSDERGPRAPERERDDWYRENRPPHHEDR